MKFSVVLTYFLGGGRLDAVPQNFKTTLAKNLQIVDSKDKNWHSKLNMTSTVSLRS